jgi:hypothetical protein
VEKAFDQVLVTHNGSASCPVDNILCCFIGVKFMNSLEYTKAILVGKEDCKQAWEVQEIMLELDVFHGPSLFGNRNVLRDRLLKYFTVP